MSDPAGIKRVLLDNVANYPKAALDIRILSTAFGDGLLSTPATNGARTGA